MFDLVVRNGEIVNSAGSEGCADIGIVNGIIVQIGGEMEGDQQIDASGKLVLPGGVDAHVHLSVPPGQETEEPTWVDDFTSGSAAALAGGITTLGNITFPISGETPLETHERDVSVARSQTIADLIIHPVIYEMNTDILDSIPFLLDEGCNSIKLFTVFPTFDPNLPDYLEVIQRAGDHGLVTLIHCEDYAIIKSATERLVSSNKSALRYYPLSRPVISEVIATQRAVAFAEETRSPIYIVHLSSARALEVCTNAQARNLPVYVETRPLYLHLTSERFNDEDGAKYVGQPPLREQSDVDALWAGIRQGIVHTVCTDHAPWTLSAKLDTDHTIDNLRPGVANLQTMLPMLYSEGVRTGRISLSRFVEITSTNASKIFGIFPRKGTIAVGSDADLVVFDPNLTLTIENKMLKSNSDYSAFEGWQVTGWPEITIRRGEVVYRDGLILGQPGNGKILPRGKTELL
jgi:dihydropyrimidinase